MLHKEIPFLRICVVLCAGIISGLFYKPGTYFPLLFASFTIILFLVTLRHNIYKKDYIFGALFNLTLFALGLYMYCSWKDSITILKPESGLFECIVSDYPEVKPSTLLLSLKLRNRYEGTIAGHVKGSVIVYHEKESGDSFLPGDILTIELTPQPITNRGNPYEFDYRFYMENQGIRYCAFTDKKDIREHISPEKRRIRHKALIIRQKIVKMYSERGVSAKRLPLVAAITLGEKSMIDREVKEKFIRAGIMHIMAVSGLHAVILSMFIFKILFFLNGRYNLLRIALTILLLWSFAFVTGLTASVLRATLMYSFLQAGNILHRRVNGINSVLASAFVLILIRPPVIFDAGFLLSYSAVIFIIAFYSKMNELVKTGNLLISWIWQSFSVTTVAQAGTLALTITLFNRFPPYFLITNMIIVPLSSFVVILGCILPIFYKMKIISGFIGSCIDKTTWLTEQLTERAGKLPFSSIEDIGMTLPEASILAVLIFITMIFLFSKKKKITLLLLLVLFYLSASTIKDISVENSAGIVVYNTPGSVNVGIRTGNKLTIYSDTNIINPDIRRHCATLNLNADIKNLESIKMVQISGKKIVICNNARVNPEITARVDLFIFTDNFETSGLKNLSDSCAIIATGRDRYFNSENKIHYIRKSGAYQKYL